MYIAGEWGQLSQSSQASQEAQEKSEMPVRTKAGELIGRLTCILWVYFNGKAVCLNTNQTLLQYMQIYIGCSHSATV